jgi:hypothetical protein
MKVASELMFSTLSANAICDKHSSLQATRPRSMYLMLDISLPHPPIDHVSQRNVVQEAQVAFRREGSIEAMKRFS